MNKFFKQLNGSALLISIFILAGIFIMAFGVGYVVFFSIKNADTQAQSMRAYYAAEAGEEYVKYATKNSCIAETLAINIGRTENLINVSCYDASNLLTATSTALIGNVKKIFTIDNPPYFSGMELWLRADKGVTTDIDGGVTQWEDYSSNGHIAVQATTSSRPTLLENSLNGYPVLNYVYGSGVGNYLQINDPINYNSIFIVARFNKTTFSDEYNGLLGDITGSEYGYGHILAGVYQTSKITHPNTPYLSEAWRNGRSLFKDVWGSASAFDFQPLNEYWVGSFILSDDFSQTSNSVGTINPFPSRGWDGQIAEILVYNRKLSPIEIILLQKYLGNKYNISVAP